MELTRCTKCVTPETHETITFDTQGICNICNQIEYKNTKIDWDLRKDELGELIEKYRGKNDYDCLIPYSGGKDSTTSLQLIWYALAELPKSKQNGDEEWSI